MTLWVGRYQGQWVVKLTLPAATLVLPAGARIDDAIALAERIKAAPVCVEARCEQLKR